MSHFVKKCRMSQENVECRKRMFIVEMIVKMSNNASNFLTLNVASKCLNVWNVVSKVECGEEMSYVECRK